MISMDRNTSPISPFTAEDYQRAFQETAENHYPDQEIVRFKEIYAQISGWPVDSIELANGSDEWLQKLMIVYGRGGVLTLSPDFFMYQDYARQIGVDIQFIEADDAFEFNLKTIIAEIQRVKPQLFILSNPHNPTGRQFEEAFLQAIADEMAAIGGYFVIDEAYIEFGADYKRPLGDHVILLRTMSKIFGMAGLRIGILYATGQTYADLTAINHPYPLNNLALNLASNFLEDPQRRATFVAYQLECTQLLRESFAGIVPYKATSSNFIFTYGPSAISLGEYLRANGFKGRFYQEANLQEVVRYSIIKEEAYPILQTLLSTWQAEQGGAKYD